MRTPKRAVLVIALTLAWSQTGRGAEQESSPQIDRRAFEQLKRMSDYLGNSKNFRVDALSTLDVVLESGQKIQYNASSKVDVSRPQLKSRRIGAFADLFFLYDGQRFVLYDGVRKSYAISEAPATLDEALTEARERLDLQAPGTDLLYSDVDVGLMEDVTELKYLGLESVDGTPTHHIAARKKDVDWQLWIQEGDVPLPRKYVITTTSMPQAPQFEVMLYNWNMAPTFQEGTFSFDPPAGAERIQFLELPEPSDVQGR